MNLTIRSARNRPLQSVEAVESERFRWTENNVPTSMTDSIATADVEAAIDDVTHPEIDATLVELGMIDAIDVTGSDVEIAVAIPMLGIPQAVKEILRDRLRMAVAAAGGDCTVSFVEMDDAQRAAFFEMEEQNWSGGLDGADASGEGASSDTSPPF